MQVTSTVAAPTRVTGTLAGRIGALAGCGFALSLFVGVAILDTPRGATDRELIAWWSESSHRVTAIVSMELFVAAGLCFLVFLSALRSRLMAAERGDGQVTALVGAAGVVFVAMLFVAAAARGVIGFAVESPANSESLPGPDTLRYLPQIGYVVTGTGGLAAAALAMAGTSWLVVTTAVFRRWLAWVGGAATAAVVVASLLLSAVFAIPALLVWAIATSVALWSTSDTKGDRT